MGLNYFIVRVAFEIHLGILEKRDRLEYSRRKNNTKKGLVTKT